MCIVNNEEIANEWIAKHSIKLARRVSEGEIQEAMNYEEKSWTCWSEKKKF